MTAAVSSSGAFYVPPPFKVTARVQRVSPKATQPVRDRTETRARITCPQNSGSFHFVEFISIGNVQN